MLQDRQWQSGAERRWRGIVEEQERSGLAVRAFCEARGLATPTFYDWRRRLTASRRGTAFVPVEVRPAASRPSATVEGSGAGVEVVLSSGRRLRLDRGFDGQVLAAAVAALEGRPC